ncbi:MAG: hypothetical protein J6B96_02630 [Agathobacter sp.]|nr:hypothetical protein [Agathobacter sp.]
MEYFIIAFLFFIILILIVFGIIYPIYKNHFKATGGIINYDITMREFVYKTNLQHDDVVELLSMRSDNDELLCEFDFNRSIIKFSEYGSNREYYFQIQRYDGFSILRLEQVALIGMSSHVPYKLNPFIISKLQAEIVPFTEYGF